ncbi:hypothetical protein GCM10027160_44060 [Streptomyces calidiresistens]|nr:MULTISPECIES: hypothetical protein [Streptomyces]
MEEFIMRLDAGMREYFRDMARFMSREFGITYSEAVARINSSYGKLKIDPYPDLMCHEEPDFWAFGAYYDLSVDEKGAFRWWDPEADRSSWPIREAPEKGSRYWTLPEGHEAPPPLRGFGS